MIEMHEVILKQKIAKLKVHSMEFHANLQERIAKLYVLFGRLFPPKKSCFADEIGMFDCPVKPI